MLVLIKVEWILIGCQCFYCSSAEKKGSESDFNKIVPVCHYHCSWDLDFAMLKKNIKDY